MGFGQAIQDATYSKPANETFVNLQKALNMIGKVKNADKTTLTIEGTSNYGLQGVKLKVKITRQGDASIVSISGFGDDIWAAGAKKCIKRLLEAVESLDDPDCEPNRTVMKPAKLKGNNINVGLTPKEKTKIYVENLENSDCEPSGMGIKPMEGNNINVGLTPKEKTKIYKEEIIKARAQKEIELEKVRKESAGNSQALGCLLAGLIIVAVIIWFVYFAS